MFRPKSKQQSLFSSSMLLTQKKLERLQGTWAWHFRTRALPLIDEDQFRDLYCDDNGRPNKPVQTLIGLLLLKEMQDLTDEEALFALEFNLAWHAALDLEPEEAHCCQKTLHNFRTKLMASDRGRLLFASLADRILDAVGVKATKQRMDSSHITSNIARLTRLGLFCETIRVFLTDLRSHSVELFDGVPVGLRGRYLKGDGGATRFEDAKSGESRRRLGVCARDAWRLVDRFREKVVGMESYALLQRLVKEQCEVVEEPPSVDPDDPDAGDPPVPVRVRDAKEVSSASLQSPHDPDVTYSGHKGKGYEVQVVETFGNGEKPEIITHVAVTRSCESDEAAIKPAILALEERGNKPEVLVADTTFASTANVIACAEAGTELLGPVGGGTKATVGPEAVREGFTVDAGGERRSRCPAGLEAVSEDRPFGGSRICATFGGPACVTCLYGDACPARMLPDGTRLFGSTVHAAVLDQRRRYEATADFGRRYAVRAGIEATNSELKRQHGLGRLRVRGVERVTLAVYLKAAACNVKRMLTYAVDQARRAAKAGAASLVVVAGDSIRVVSAALAWISWTLDGPWCRTAATAAA